jgi:hypothetical protein
MWEFLKRPKRLTNIAVYCVSHIVEGDVKARPIGVMPRFTDEYEKAIREKHKLRGRTIIGEQMGDASILLSWTSTKTIDAVCFIIEKEARAVPGFIEFEDNTLDPVLTHFPR